MPVTGLLDGDGPQPKERALPGLDDLLNSLPIDQLAAKLGIDPQTANQLAGTALPALLEGMGANAQDPQAKEALANAVQQHDPALLEGGIDLDQVDTADGEKIVGHVFGDKTDAVAERVGLSAGADGGMVKSLLPMLAPVVMAFLAKQMAGGGGQQAQAGEAPGGDIGDLLGGLLGGGGGGGLGGLLGGLFGGNR
jgi:hypothetical protein